MIHPESRLVRHVLEYNGIMPVNEDSHDWQMLWSTNSVNPKIKMVTDLCDGQKLNQFFNVLELCHKDKFVNNFDRMLQKHGEHMFDFLPESYSYPD